MTKRPDFVPYPPVRVRGKMLGMRAPALGGSIGLAALLLAGCFASVTSVAHDMFARDYDCPTAEERVLPTTQIEVVGCGHDEQFNCTAGFTANDKRNSSPTRCSYRPRSAFTATDGSVRETWNASTTNVGKAWGNDSSDAEKETAILSAVHDLPCARASITLIDNLTLEGCGQRVTYRQIDGEITTTPPGHFHITTSHRYLLVGRIPIVGASVVF
jgi:hypothetical protein